MIYYKHKSAFEVYNPIKERGKIMSIGTTIKRLRREKNLTQEQLADHLGITSRAISAWECDRTAPDISQLPVLASVFNVSADVLLEIEGGKRE